MSQDFEKVIRPWGSFQTIEQTIGDNHNTCQVKRIIVMPQQKLSLQYHDKRSEHWIVTKGTIVAQVGDDFHRLDRNQNIYIPKHVKHRIINDSNESAELIEVQIGEYIGEDDIVRLQDDYGRI